MELNPAKHVRPRPNTSNTNDDDDDDDHASEHHSPFNNRTQSQHTLDTLDTLDTADTHLPDDSSSQPSPSRPDESVSASGSPSNARRRAANRQTARNSTAYVRNYRLSRYRNAMRGALPFRLQRISDEAELPLDSIGCVSASTFSWARRYRVPDPPLLRGAATRWRCWPWPFCRRRGAAEAEIPAAADVEAPPQPAPQPASPPLAPPLVPSLPAADRCEVNAKRLLGLYKYEEQSRGRIGASMTRVAWQFCRTRLAVATAALVAAQLAAVLQLGLFLQLGMLLIDESWVFGVPVAFQGNGVLLRRYMGYHLQTGLIFGALLACLLAQSYLRGTAHAIGLRTAIRLRTACLGAVCSKSLKSAVRHTVAAHQIAALAADEGRHLSEAVVRAPALLANLLGLVFCAVAAGCSLGAPGVWPLLGVIGLLPIGVLGALLSAIYYQRSLSFLAKKLTIVEEYFVAYDPDEGLRRHESYAKRFAGALHTQYVNLCKAERFRAPGQAPVFALSVIVGGAHLVWCDMKFPLEATPMTAIACMYVLLVPAMVGEWLEAVQAMAYARGVLAKVKQALTLAAPELPKMRPTRDLKVLIADAVFRWTDVATDAGGANGVAYANGNAATTNSNSSSTPASAAPPPQFELRIDSLTIAKNSLVGVTGAAGSGKTALVHALLGHLPLRAGEFYQRDKGSLYPEVPYRLEGASIRENIVFHDDWNEQRYREALLLAELHFNEGADVETTIDEVQDLLQLQRVGMARALYSDRDFAVLEEPLSAVDLEPDLSALFEVCTDRLREQGKTVVVVSQNESILRHCQRIYLLTGGRSAGYLDHEDAQQQPEYRRCLEEYAERKRAARQSMHLGAMGGLTSVHNISTEDLVEAAAVEPTGAESKTPWLLSRCQMATLAALRVLDAIYTFNVPIVTVIYLTHASPPTPWAVFNVLLFVPILMATGWLTTTWLSRVGRGVHKSLEKRQFRKLLGTALADQRDALLGQLQHTMMENSLRKFRNNADAAFGWWVVLMCVMWCFVNKSVMFMAVLVPLLSSCHRVLRYYLTVHRYGMLESETRLKLLHLLGNQLRGRVVIQSFDAVQRLRQSLYRAVEENAAAELVMRGTIAYNQHSFVFWQTVTLAFCLFLLNAYPHQQALEFGIEVYFYLMAVGQLSRMIGYRLENCNHEQRLSSAHWMLQSAGDNSAAADISTLRYTI